MTPLFYDCKNFRKLIGFGEYITTVYTQGASSPFIDTSYRPGRLIERRPSIKEGRLIQTQKSFNIIEGAFIRQEAFIRERKSILSFTVFSLN